MFMYDFCKSMISVNVHDCKLPSILKQASQHYAEQLVITFTDHKIIQHLFSTSSLGEKANTTSNTAISYSVYVCITHYKITAEMPSTWP